MSKALPQPTPAHTPGPWTRKRLDANHSMIHAANGMTVVPRMITEPFTSSEADGALIASAPQLVQALQTALPALWKLSMRRHVRLGHGGTEVPNGTSCQLCEIQANEGVELNHLDTCPISIVRSALRASTLSTDTDKQKGTP
jgi:hypothetical protein